MSKDEITRREMLRSSGLALVAGGLTGMLSCSSNESHEGTHWSQENLPFRVSLNTSTIRGYHLPVEEQIDLSAEAGFDGIELWVSDVESYIDGGGSVEALADRIKQQGLVLENMIAFSTWIADDARQRAEGVRKMQQDMELTARLGGSYIAAPLQGIVGVERARLLEYAERYHAILEEGERIGITPLLELWGAGALNQLSDASAISIGAAHPRASLLLDFYHLYRGGNSFDALRQLNGGNLPVFHINDFPESIPRESLIDADRVFPGDGSCPFDLVIPLLYDTGFCGAFSIELFNQGYWDSMDVKSLLKQSYNKTVNTLVKTVNPRNRK